MLLTKEVKIKVSTKSLKYYREKGYDCNVGDIITVKVEDLTDSNKSRIEYQCDNPECNKIFETSWQVYKYRQHNKAKDAGDFCIHCNKKMRAKWLKENNPKEFEKENELRRKGMKKNLMERFGVENPMQVEEFKENFKNNFKEKYGEDNPAKVEEFRQKMSDTMQTNRELIECTGPGGHTYYRYAGVSVSRSQKHFWDIYGGILNYPVKTLTVDILLENNIYFEYNGTGHYMDTRIKGLTEDEVKHKEIVRYYILKREGYKAFTYHSTKTDKLPDDKILLSLKRIALEYLKEDNHNWITFDKDNNLIKTKFATIDYNYDKPLTKRILKKLS